MFRESLYEIEDTPYIITFNFISARHVTRLRHNTTQPLNYDPAHENAG